MVCPRCTLLHSVEVSVCTQCGLRLQAPLQVITSVATRNAATSIGIVSSVSLLTCLAIAVIFPTVAVAALSMSAYFGILSISNIWLAVYRDAHGDMLRGLRGVGYSCALLVSLAAELARLQHVHAVSVPEVGSMQVPSAATTSLLAIVLVILDPLVVRPLVHWIELGVERGVPEG
jgi:hypothetical protein